MRLCTLQTHVPTESQHQHRSSISALIRNTVVAKGSALTISINVTVTVTVTTSIAASEHQQHQHQHRHQHQHEPALHCTALHCTAPHCVAFRLPRLLTSCIRRPHRADTRPLHPPNTARTMSLRKAKYLRATY
ncbi:hypothetical protein EsH8_V_000399 [Colletotrichum jinshuiense]